MYVKYSQLYRQLSLSIAKLIPTLSETSIYTYSSERYKNAGFIITATILLRQNDTISVPEKLAQLLDFSTVINKNLVPFRSQSLLRISFIPQTSF